MALILEPRWKSYVVVTTKPVLTLEHMPPVRKISMTLLLSDPKDFEGGELELIDDKKRPNLKRGYAIFFASFIRHRVKPIIKGNRKSLVMWFGGPPLK
jgi:PKHD-type hydroxylase